MLGEVAPGTCVTVNNIATPTDVHSSSAEYNTEVCATDAPAEPKPEPTEKPVAPPVDKPKPGQPLEITGANAAPMLLIAGALLALGGGLYVLGKRRRHVEG